VHVKDYKKAFKLNTLKSKLGLSTLASQPTLQVEFTAARHKPVPPAAHDNVRTGSLGSSRLAKASSQGRDPV